MATNPDTPKPIGIPIGLFVASNPSLAVPVAGLLHLKPELHDVEKTPPQWQAALDAYLKTSIDPAPVDPTESA